MDSTFDWQLIEDNWHRLHLLDLIELADIKHNSKPTKEDILNAVQVKLKQRIPNVIFEDLRLAISHESQIKAAGYERNSLNWVPIEFPDIRFQRIIRCIDPLHSIEILFGNILYASQAGQYPESELLEFFREYLPGPKSGVWQSIDQYPKVVEYLLPLVPLNSNEFRAFICRIIERNHLETYRVFRKWLQETGFKNENQFLLLRPYLLKEANLEILDDLRVNFGLDDFEYRARLEGREITYSRPGPIPFDPDYYFGYRQAWHYLEYGPKKDRFILFKYWSQEIFDCTYNAFVDWVNWKTGEKILTHGAERDEVILKLLSEI